MAVPKKKTSHSKKNMRRAQNSKIPSSSFTIDKVTGFARRNHHIGADGTYRGMQIIDVKEKSVAQE